MTIRGMQPTDIVAGLRLCRLSQWNQLEEDWRAFLESPDGGGLLAESGGDVHGTVTFLRYGRPFTWLSMMLVDPEARGRGVGTQLMEAALEALATDTCVRLDATPLGEPLYRRFGFNGEEELGRAKITALPGVTPHATQSISPMIDADLPQAFERDLREFGADRSAILTSFHRRAPQLAFVRRDGHGLSGYCFGRPGYLYRQIGPVVADDASTAQALVECCLANHPGEIFAVDLPRTAGE